MAIHRWAPPRTLPPAAHHEEKEHGEEETVRVSSMKPSLRRKTAKKAPTREDPDELLGHQRRPGNAVDPRAGVDVE